MFGVTVIGDKDLQRKVHEIMNIMDSKNVSDGFKTYHEVKPLKGDLDSDHRDYNTIYANLRRIWLKEVNIDLDAVVVNTELEQVWRNHMKHNYLG